MKLTSGTRWYRMGSVSFAAIEDFGTARPERAGPSAKAVTQLTLDAAAAGASALGLLLSFLAGVRCSRQAPKLQLS